MPAASPRQLVATALTLLVITTGVAPAQSSDASGDPLRGEFDAAVAVHQSADQYESIALLTALIGRLESRGELSPEARDLLARAYFMRSEAHFNFGETHQAGDSLAAAVRTDPNLQVDLAMVSPKLAELLEQTRSQLAGVVESSVEPADAVAHIEGAPSLSTGERVALLAGRYDVEITRPGYESARQTLDIAAGERLLLDTRLVRTSAVLNVLTDVPGLTVLIDGREVGVTEALAEGGGRLAVDGLETGTHTVELRGRGYRERRLQLDLTGLDDYATDVIRLDSTRGTVRLGGVRPGAVVRVNGVEQSLSGADSEAFEVPAGANRVEVDYRGVGRFVRDFDVADGQAIGFEVELRPVIALLGVLGGDRRSADRVHAGVRDSLAGSPGWTVADHSNEGAATIAAGGLDIDTFRELSMASPRVVSRYDWSKLQRACDQRFAAAACLVGVLSDDLIASTADLWILPAAPHPARPQKIRTEVGGADVVARTLEPLSHRPSFARPWLGVRFVETNAAPGLVVLNVTPGSPAETAGLRPGDLVRATDGREVDRLFDLERILERIGPHADLRLTIDRPAGSVEVDVMLGTSPMVLSWTDPKTFYPLYLGWLEIERMTGQSELEPWLIELNRASALMGLDSWTDAIQLLRTIEAPSGGGVGQAMVDYWLGMALIRTDPSQYRDIAIDALSRAEAAPTARLYHNDGPLISPLAAAGKKIVSGG